MWVEIYRYRYRQFNNPGVMTHPPAMLACLNDKHLLARLALLAWLGPMAEKEDDYEEKYS